MAPPVDETGVVGGERGLGTAHRPQHADSLGGVLQQCTRQGDGRVGGNVDAERVVLAADAGGRLPCRVERREPRCCPQGELVSGVEPGPEIL